MRKEHEPTMVKKDGGSPPTAACMEILPDFQGCYRTHKHSLREFLCEPECDEWWLPGLVTPQGCNAL